MTTHMRYRVPRACSNIYFSNEYRASMQSNMSNRLHLFFFLRSWQLIQIQTVMTKLFNYHKIGSLSHRIGGNRESSEQPMNVDCKSIEFTICRKSGKQTAIHKVCFQVWFCCMLHGVTADIKESILELFKYCKGGTS